VTTNRITKKDRILADAAALADALDGPWTIASRLRQWLPELVLLGLGVETLLVVPSLGRHWGYQLCLLPPREITGWTWG
jgi:hypothetical protein